MAKYNIGGYIFDDENKARKAAKELKNVEYILSQIKDADEHGVLNVYKKLLNQRLFSTEIGMDFLTQLRQNLLESGVFSDEEIPAIYSLDETKEQVSVSAVNDDSSEDSIKPKVDNKKTDTKKREKDESSEIRRLKVINKLLIILCVSLVLIVVGMFYVNSTINSPTILNYEEQLLNKYSSWEQELTEREAAVKEKELGQQ